MVVILLACGEPSEPKADRADSDAAVDTQVDPDSPSETDSTPPDSDSPVDTVETDSPPPDADGDGYTPGSGPDEDCDDGDPEVHPGATEWCNGRDADCDGIPMAEGVCAELQDFDAWATTLYEGGYAQRGIRDVTGDGAPDLLSLADDHYLLYAGPLDPPYPESPEGASHAWDSGGCIINMQLDAGDLDGDGYNDVLLPVTDCSNGDGVYVAWGPIPTDGVYEDIWDVATWWTTAPDPSWVWGDGVGAGEDLDGDRAAEVVAAADSDGGGSGAEIAVLFGARTDAPDSVAIGPVSSSAHDFLLTPDMDGDGLGELILWWWDGDHPIWIAGGDLRTADGAYVLDLAAGELDTPICQPYGAETAMPWAAMPVGDWDGDGLPDLLYASEPDTAPLTVRHYGRLVPGTNTSIGEVRTSFNNSFVTMLGRDRDELLVADDDGLAWHVLDPAPLTSSVDIDDLPELSYGCPTSRDNCSAPRFHEDLDGDGVSDGVVTTRNEDDGYTIKLLPGFDIPWDDPFYW